MDCEGCGYHCVTISKFGSEINYFISSFFLICTCNRFSNYLTVSNATIASNIDVVAPYNGADPQLQFRSVLPNLESEFKNEQPRRHCFMVRM